MFFSAYLSVPPLVIAPQTLGPPFIILAVIPITSDSNLLTLGNDSVCKGLLMLNIPF